LLYFIDLFELVVTIDEFGFIVVVDADCSGTSEFDETDFLNSVSFSIDTAGGI
jgi:hypothetical protein